MDRNVVTASILIGLIMLGWMYFLSPPMPPPPGPDGVSAGDTLFAEPTTPVPDEPAASRLNEVLPTAASDSLLTAAAEGTDRLLTVVTEQYVAQFSTRGGTPRSIQLRNYQTYDRRSQVEMVDTSGQGALSLVFTTPGNHLVDTRALHFDPSLGTDTLRVADAPTTLSFTANVGEGQIIKTYTFSPDAYEIALEVVQQNAAAFATDEGYELVWNGGVPFSEEDTENEALYAGVYARSGGEVEGLTLQSDAYQEQLLSGQVDWVAVKDKYFAAVIMPQQPTEGAELIGERTGQTDQDIYKEDYAARMRMPAAQGEPDRFVLYVGPMDYLRVKDYERDLYDMVDYGFDAFEWMTRPLAKYVFIPLFGLLGGFLPNYGLVIILLALLIKIAVWPLTKSSYRSMAKMKDVQPKMKEIQEKHKDNPQKQQEAMMKLYRESGANPIGGCLPMLLQYPIIIALWQFLPQSIEIRQQGFLWAPDLSAPDVILNLPIAIPFYGDFVAGFTLLMGLSMVVQMRIQMASQPVNPQMKLFTYFLPVMLFFFFNRLASGLSLYYLCYNIITAFQQKLINRSLEKEKEQENQAGKKPGRRPKPSGNGRDKASKSKKKAVRR
ncbi:MAG: membrane protein insertase YidC [Bacteroidota bacterium]